MSEKFPGSAVVDYDPSVKVTTENKVKVVDTNRNREEDGPAPDMKRGMPFVFPWIADPVGYFLIRINRDDKTMELGLCGYEPPLNVITTIIRGSDPSTIYQEAIKRGMLTRMDHAAYLGKELMKAWYALEHGFEYVQDGGGATSPLKI